MFRSPRQKEQSKDKQQISSLTSDCALFSRLFISCETREGDLDDLFEHQNQGCPPYRKMESFVFQEKNPT